MAADLPEPLRLARFGLLKSRRYLGHLVWSLIPVESPGLGTLGVDRYHRLYYDPMVFDYWGPDELIAVLYHECHHLLRQHSERFEHVGDRDRARVATDLEINSHLVVEGVELPDAPWVGEGDDVGKPVTTAGYELADGLLAEEYYDQLPEVTYLWLPGGCGSCAGGGPDDHELPPSSKTTPGVGNAEAVLIRNLVAQDIKGCGSAPASLQRWADELLCPKINWRDALGASIRRQLAEAAGCVDYSFRKLSRRDDPDFCFPALVGHKVRVAVVVDTSGSMSEDDLSRALSEVKGILWAANNSAITVMSVDAEVHTTQEVFTAHKVELVGGGGTDMGLGIAAANALKPRPDVCIVLTDGYTGWPEHKPPMRVVVGLIGGHAAGAASVPSWATAIEIGV